MRVTGDLERADQKILDVVSVRLEVPPHCFISNLTNNGNTSTASIPLYLDGVHPEWQNQSETVLFQWLALVPALSGDQQFLDGDEAAVAASSRR
ncbi:hypothetical protein MLD38_020895 [Melastoma candidum]|uniref:Uncharacterized protein n=1 Tax=Melastoma candidum TaxID=119954 RepID=A0ACB9QEB1_9MYRT|nr:hypothetical protein MLD38_020895 [Melastoma candidum]